MRGPFVTVMAGLASVLSPAAFGGTNTSTTTPLSSRPVAINAIYVGIQQTIGPGSILVGTLVGCTLVGSPPFPGCSFVSGTGTAGDPFAFSCSGPVPLAGCSGQSFTVLAGTNNFNIQTHTVTAAAVVATQQVPLGPWVPVASAGAVLLAALLLRRRRRSPG